MATGTIALDQTNPALGDTVTFTCTVSGLHGNQTARVEVRAYQDTDSDGQVDDLVYGDAWGTDQPCDNPTDDGSDRCPGETWVERAYRGPSPANPSVSLKARLHRAAFFDKREREVAAGKAAPIDPDAGLPEAMVEEQEREVA